MMLEGDVERAAIQTFADIGYEHTKGSDIPREDTSTVVIESDLQDALERLNPDLPEDVLNDVVVELTPSGGNPKHANPEMYELLVSGVSVEYETPEGDDYGTATVIDFENPDQNEWRVVSQLDITHREKARTPDLVVFINGLPIAVFEFKDPRRDALRDAYEQVTDTYVRDIPQLFQHNQFVVVADSDEARMGSLTADWKWFSPWRYLDEEGDYPPTEWTAQDALIHGAFDKNRVLDLIKNFVLHTTGGTPNKVVATYYQYYGVREAVEHSLDVVLDDEEQRVGVYWHAQGSGKSLSIVFYVRLLRQYARLNAPSFVILTDEVALDRQLYEVFQEYGLGADRADTIPHLRRLLNRNSGGIVFTTMHKFQTLENEEEVTHPVVNTRQNLLFVADEAHRSQMAELGENVRTALPNASRIGFTATPIHEGDRVTREYFGEYISKYQTDKAQNDGAVVPVNYVNRAPELNLNTDALKEAYSNAVSETDEDITLDEVKQWVNIRTILENEDRMRKIAANVVEHFNERQLNGKALVVAVSRQTAVKYQRYINQHNDAPQAYAVISGADDFFDDPMDDEKLKRRFKDVDDEFRIAIVCDKWTTGFNVPCLHTLYLDKPMRGHNLVQTLGRVNRVYKDKRNGLVVDYVGIKEMIDVAFAKYTSDYAENVLEWDSDGLLSQLDETLDDLYRFCSESSLDGWTDALSQERQRLVKSVQDEVVASDDAKACFLDAFEQAEEAYLRLHPTDETQAVTDHIAFFRIVYQRVTKTDGGSGGDSLVKEIVDDAIRAGDLVELDEEDELVFEETTPVEIGATPNLVVDRARRKAKEELGRRKMENVARYEQLEEELRHVVTEYNMNRIPAEDAFDGLADIYEEVTGDDNRAETLGLTDGQLAVYDAADSEVDTMTDDDLVAFAKAVDDQMADVLTVDWEKRSGARSKVTHRLEGLLAKHRIPKENREAVCETLLEQFRGSL
jgi:type I restriction enzyme R subunit